MFGGRQSGVVGQLSDTWEYNGFGGWQQVVTSNAPAAHSSGMVYDAARGQCVLFGGIVGATVQNETWLYNGFEWSQASPSTVPPARYGPGMAYDSDRNVVVMFGGNHDDTWEWDGTDWTQVQTQHAPSARRAAIAYDASRQRVVLFGGEIYRPYGLANDTWEYDGNDWQQVAPAGTPSSRTHQALVYDERRQRIVMFGGIQFPFGPIGDTWEYDGASWTQVSPLTSPSARYGVDHAVYDTIREAVMMFAGGSPQLNDTWFFDGGNTGMFSVLGPPCGSPVAITGTRPVINQQQTTQISGTGSLTGFVVAFGLSDKMSSAGPLPLSLGAAGLPQCSLRTSADFVDVLLTSQGSASVTVTIPNQLNLLFTTYYVQALSIDLNAGLSFPGTSALCRAVVGF